MPRLKLGDPKDPEYRRIKRLSVVLYVIFLVLVAGWVVCTVQR